MATIIIPVSLRKFTNNIAKIRVKGGILSQSLEELTTNFPELKKMLIDDHGRIRSYVNVFVGTSDIRNLQQEQTIVGEDAVISIIPADEGGG